MRNRYLGLLPLCMILLASLSKSWGAAAIPRQNLSRFTPAQWSATFAVVVNLPLAQRMAFWADLAAVDSTYTADPLGEGPNHPPDPDPLCDFTRVDCVTYVEQVCALALSASIKTFPDTLQKIRYRDGQLDYRWRNHYFVSDWLPANCWFVRDVTDEVGKGLLKSMTKTISRGKFFAGKGLQQYADLPDEEGTASYIPRTQIKEVAGKLQTGDLVIFVIDTKGIIAGHTGLIRMKDGMPYLQHASLSAKAVVTVPLQDYLRTAPARFLGFKIARPFMPVPVKPDEGQ